ncbi:MAG: hypothetical protein IH945_11300 [Armatimonadetes bacterium]|nr:hypothetical protein [Armatimonadota bacterium]
MEEISETARIAEVQDKHESELLALPNVVGVAASLKVKAGKPTKKWCLTVFVEKKQDIKKGKVAPRVDGVETDVVEVGKIGPLPFTARVRPILPGYSIGHHNITAGTNGCLVRDIRRCCCGQNTCDKRPCCDQDCPSDYLILSNNHILADSNQASLGDLILQPGPVDGGVYPADGVATLERFEPIVFGASGYNLVDAAVARPLEVRNATASIIGLLIPKGVDQAFIGGLVIKAGRTTQVTVGRVTAVNATVVVSGYSGGSAQFRHQIMTTAMSAGGDSGSLLMDSGLNAVGLLFAGSPWVTIHNHIADVETALGVRPLTAPRYG